MKYATILTTGLAAMASASLVERSADDYKKIIDGVAEDIDSLDKAVQDYSGSDKDPVVKASDTLVDTINDANEKIKGLDDVSASDALPLSSSLMSLNTKAQGLTEDLKAKRGDVEKAGECDTVRKAIEKVNSSSQELVNTAISKVPKGLQNIAEGFVSSFTQSFNDTQDYFSSSNCKNGANDSSSGGSSASSTTNPSQTSSQTAASPSGSSGASLLAPAWTIGTALLVLALYN